jgi:hypothetical protein
MVSPEISYLNKRGKRVVLQLTAHARRRMLQRWPRVHPTRPITFDTVDTRIAELFASARRVTKLSHIEKTRSKRHGKDTLLFRIDEFTFVVQDASIITVEISAKEKRYLNKRPDLPAPPPVKVEKPKVRPASTPGQSKPPVEEGKPLPRFRIFATAEDADGKLRTLGLGSYDSEPVGGEAERLRTDPAFRTTVIERYRAKNVTWVPIGILVRLGASGDFRTVFREHELPELDSRHSA